jgi:hypothetical protein
VAPVLAGRALVPNWIQSAIDPAPSQGSFSLQQAIDDFNLGPCRTLPPTEKHQVSQEQKKP